MRILSTLIVLLLFRGPAPGQDSLVIPEPQILPLADLEMEALARNPAILASLEGISEADARARRSGTVDPPEFTWRRMEMPGFRWREAMANEFELMQMFRFPTKYGTESDVEAIRAEHAHHEAEEVVNMVLYEVREGYAELWYLQQRQALQTENLRLAGRLREIADARYRVGSAGRQDALMAEMLRTGAANTLIDLRQRELAVKARLQALLGRRSADTLGYAVVDEAPAFDRPIDSLIALARRTRPMLIHDSLGIREEKTMLSAARQEYLPDLRIGVAYKDSEHELFTGWMVSAGITLPFVPWNLGRLGAGVAEGEHRVRRSAEQYSSTRTKVEAEVRAAHLGLTGALRRLGNIGNSSLPAAEQALAVSLSLYQEGQTDYPMVHQAYAAFLGAQEEYFMTRMEFETAVARLRLATGYNGAW